MPKSESMAIFRVAADGLGAMLTERGFTYRKTNREAKRDGEMFEHSISFRTSRSLNSIPGHVELEVRATAWSEPFGDHRRANGIDLPINEACLFDCPIENIFKKAPPYIRYNIGNPSERSDVIRSIESTLVEEVLPVFGLIESPERLKEHLAQSSIPCLEDFDAQADYFSYAASLT